MRMPFAGAQVDNHASWQSSTTQLYVLTIGRIRIHMKLLLRNNMTSLQRWPDSRTDAPRLPFPRHGTPLRRDHNRRAERVHNLLHVRSVDVLRYRDDHVADVRCLFAVLVGRNGARVVPFWRLRAGSGFYSLPGGHFGNACVFRSFVWWKVAGVMATLGPEDVCCA